MKKNKEIVIVDLKENNDYQIQNCDVINTSAGFLETKNVNIIKLNRISDKKIKNHKKNLLNKLSIYKKYITLDKKIDANLLEIFNLRNDKTKLFDKIFFILHIRDFLKKKKYYKITYISDDPIGNEFYKILKTKNSKLILLNKKTKKNYFLYFLFRNSFFSLKMFFLLIYLKLFLQKPKTNEKKSSNEACLSLYPQFYNLSENKFYKKNLININFLVTDETHLNNNLNKNISDAKKISKLNSTILVEKSITFLDIFFSYLKSIKILIILREILNKNIYFENMKINLLFRELLVISLINYSKLQIYNSAIKKIIRLKKFKKFHYYMFEYNFGFYLNSLIKKFDPNIKTIGYQHGIYSEQLMWLSMIKKDYLPDNVVSKYNFSRKAYEKRFFKVKNYVKNDFNPIKYLRLIDKNKKNKNILVFLGLHDSKDMLYSIIQNFEKFKDKKIYLNLHPKSKKLNISRLPENIFFNRKLKNKIGLFLVSTTSTMVYDFATNKIPFKILIPNYMSPLTPRNISQKYNLN